MDIELLKRCSLFDGLPPEHMKQIAAIAVSKNYNRGESVFFDGEEADGFYLVASGKVKIFKVAFSGKEQILHIFGTGEPFGEVAVFHGRPFPASALCLEKSQLIFFPKDRFVKLVHANPAIAMNMIAMLSLRLRRFTKQIESLSLKEVPARLAGYLTYLQEEQDNTQEVTLEISKGQLASLLGTIPETLSRIFSKMTDEGLIEVSGRTIVIKDADGLEELREF